MYCIILLKDVSKHSQWIAPFTTLRFLLVSADNYVVLPNVVLRINAFEHHQGSNYSTTEGKSTIGKKMVLLKPQVVFETLQKKL